MTGAFTASAVDCQSCQPASQPTTALVKLASRKLPSQ
jgi:hypothetical protein